MERPSPKRPIISLDPWTHGPMVGWGETFFAAPCLRYPTLQHLTTIVVFQPESNLLVVKNVYAQKSQRKNPWLFCDAEGAKHKKQLTKVLHHNDPWCCIKSHHRSPVFSAAKSNPLRLRQSHWKQEFFRPASGNHFFFQIATPMNDATRFYIWKFPTESASNKPICWAVKNNSWPCWCWRWTWHP